MANLTEALTANTIDCFQSFPLEDLEEDWFNDLWINNFVSLEDYPASGNAIFREDLFQLISNAVDICEEWVELKFSVTDPENDTLPGEEVLWTVLIENNVDIKYILGFIFAVCSKGIQPSAVRFQQVNALKAAKLYFSLLRIPGNSAYNVYYPSLFQLAFDCIKFPKEKVPGKKRPPASAHRNEIMSKRKRTRRSGSLSDSPEEPIGTDDFVALDNREFREQKCDDSLLKCFIDVLKSVIPLFQTFSLSGNYELIEHITRKLSECVAVESRRLRLNFSRSVDDILTREFQRQNGLPNVVVALGYYAYLSLCQTLHGDVNEIYRLCLQSLCNHILCSNAMKVQSNRTISNKHLVVRDNALSFVCYNLKKHRNYSIEVSRILVQRLCMRCFDKTDFRSKVAFAIEKILKCFPLKVYVEMVDWLVTFITQKPQDRMIVLEIFAILIMTPERKITPEITKNWAVYATHIPLVCSIVERCEDKNATVCAKALSILTSTLKRVMEVISEVQRDFSFADEDEDVEENETDTENEDGRGKEGDAECLEEDEVNQDNGGEGDEANKTKETETENDDATSPSVKNKSEYRPCVSQFKLCSVDQLIELLLLHMMNEKHVNIRKSSVQAMEVLLCLDETYLTEKFLRYLSRATLDPNVTVKKSCVSSLTNILRKYHDNSLVQEVWMRSVLRTVLDPEKSVMSKGLEEMEELFLLKYGNSSSMKHCCWTMLTEIASGSNNDLLRYLQKAYSIWKTEDKLNPSLSCLLEAQLGTEYDAAAWMLLSILSAHIEIKNVTGFLNRWEQSSEVNVPISTQQRMLEVLGHTCKHMKADQLQDLKTSLEKPLCDFRCHFQLISRMLETLYKVYRAKFKQKNECEKLLKVFATKIMQPTEKLLSELIVDTSPFGDYSNDQICQYLQVVGDLALFIPTSVPKSMFMILQSIIAITSTSENGVNCGAFTSTAKVWRLCPKVQGVAFTALGKLCWVNEKYAQKCIPIFIKELASKSFVVRLNIVTALTDLCVRYTLMVDSYIPSISAYLKDVDVNVRIQTLSLISRLLQEDYIKLKDLLLYYLLSVLVDDDEAVRKMAEYYLCNLLAKKQQNIFVQQFAQIIFYFNASSQFLNLKVDLQKQGTRLFELKGRNNFEKRMIIYKFMTLQTPLVKRGLIFLKLSNDILNTVVTEMKRIDDETEAVIKDTLAVLSLDEFKPTQGHSNATDDNDEAEITDSVILKTMYRHVVIEKVVPIAVALKKMLSELKSPLTPDILQFIAEICTDYKNEVKDVFATDKAIVEEIAYITKKREKELEKKKREKELEKKKRNNSEDDLQPPKSSSPAVILPRIDATTSEDEQIQQFLISNGIDITKRPVVLLERISVPYRVPVNEAELFSENGLWNPNRTNNNENSRRRRTKRHRKVTNGKIPLAETPILPCKSNEHNTATGNITVCDIGNAEWDDGRHSMNSSRASTRRSRNTKR